MVVLPFTNMAGAKEDDYLCEGLAEEIINALTRIPGLRVIARTSAFAVGRAGNCPGFKFRAGARFIGGTALVFRFLRQRATTRGILAEHLARDTRTGNDILDYEASMSRAA